MVLARLIGAVLSLLLVPVAISAVAADVISARVEMYGPLGLHVLTLHTSLEETGERDSVTVDYQTVGLIGMLAEQKTRAVAQGRLARTTAYPESYRNDTTRNGIARLSTVTYAADGTVSGTSTPAPSTVVPPDLARGTVDVSTAYLRLERQLARTGKCALNVPVFDGRHRYDLAFTDVGKQQLTREAGQRFEGSAIACRMTRQNRVVEEAERNEGANQGTIWYAQLMPGDVLVPVRMKLETHIGAVDAYLAELHGRGVNLKLIE